MRLGRGTVEVMFVVLAVLGSVSCLTRPDYNLPLFAFMWWVFFHIPEDRKDRQQRYMLLLVCLSCVQDVIYLIYWPFKWFSNAWLSLPGGTEGLHVMVTLISLVELVVKVALLLVLLAQNLVDQTTDSICEWCSKVDEIEDYEVVTYLPASPAVRM